MADLCIIADVKFYGGISSTLHDSRITRMITDMSDEIRNASKNGDILTSEDYNANKACIYGVLAWLEQEGKIKSNNTSKYITKQSDGEVVTEYKASSRKGNSMFTKSFGERFEDYLSKLKALPVAGSYDDGVDSFVI